jgi:hypothetical protein
MKPRPRHVVAALATLALACGGLATGGSGSGGAGGVGGGGTTGAGGGGGSSGGGMSCEPAFVEAGTGLAGDAEVPVYHRATPSCCPSERGPAPAGQPYGPGVASTCSSNSQCTSGADGRCFPDEGLVGRGGCSYDQCFTDSDCPSGTPCLCRSSPSDTSANVCAPRGNCVLDLDCGPGGYCSPSQDCFGLPVYYCHAASDTCINDADCLFVDAGGGCPAEAICAYSSEARHWACSQQRCCPP